MAALVLVLGTLWAALLPAVAAQSSPAATVRAFHEALLAPAEEEAERSARARYDRLLPAVRDAFDMALMARVTGGQAWRNATPSEREKLEHALLRYSTASYASQFRGDPGLQFEMGEVSDGPGGTKLVGTRLAPPDGKAVDLVYVVRRRKDSDAWRIVDVLLEGDISQLAQRRSEYHRIATSEGASGLAKALNEKADQILSAP